MGVIGVLLLINTVKMGAALRSREMTMVDLPESGERRILSKMFRWNGGGDMLTATA